MKKIIASMLALVLVFGLVACGQKKNETKKEEKKAETPTITYLVHASGKDKDKVAEKINERLAELKAGYKIKFMAFSWGDYETKIGLLARGADKETFDLATTASWLGPFKTLVADKALLDLTPYLEKNAPKLAKSLTDAQKAGASIDGKLYGIQTIIDKAPMARDMFIWNVKELEKIGKKPADVQNITDTKGLEPILKAYKEKFPEKTPMRGDVWAERRLDNFIRTKSDGTYTVENYLASPELKAKFELVAKYRDAGYLGKESGTENDPLKETQKQPDQWLVSRGEGEPGSEATWTDSNKTPVVAVPVAEDNILYNENVQGKLTSVYAHTKYPEQAVNFIELARFDEKIQNLLAWGIEGTHYNVKDGRAVPVDKQEGWSPWRNQWSNDVRIPEPAGADINSPELQKKIEEYIKPIVPAADLGFNPSPDLQQKITNVLAARDGIGDLQNGRMDVYEEFVNRVKSAGADEMVKELKAEFDAWYAKNHK